MQVIDQFGKEQIVDVDSSTVVNSTEWLTTGEIVDASYSGDGATIGCILSTGEIACIHRNSGVVETLNSCTHRKMIRCDICVSPDATLIAYCDSREFFVLDVVTRSVTHLPAPHGVGTVFFRNSLLVAISRDACVTYDTTTSPLLPVLRASISPRNRYSNSTIDEKTRTVALCDKYHVFMMHDSAIFGD